MISKGERDLAYQRNQFYGSIHGYKNISIMYNVFRKSLESNKRGLMRLTEASEMEGVARKNVEKECYTLNNIYMFRCV